MKVVDTWPNHNTKDDHDDFSDSLRFNDLCSPVNGLRTSIRNRITHN